MSLPSLCHSYVLVCHLYAIHIYSYVICMSLVCTRMSSVCHLYSVVCHPYVTRIYLYVICMLLVCTCVSSASHLYLLVCHLYATCMYSFVIRISLVYEPEGVLSNFMEITIRHVSPPVNLLHIFRTPFPQNTYGGVLLCSYLCSCSFFIFI